MNYSENGFIASEDFSVIFIVLNLSYNGDFAWFKRTECRELLKFEKNIDVVFT